MKALLIIIAIALPVSGFGYVIYAKNKMFDSIEKKLAIMAPGKFSKAQLISSGPQCALPCESNILDHEFFVYGTNGCNIVYVTTYESFPKYDIQSINKAGNKCT